jgi:hypothetical protein
MKHDFPHWFIVLVIVSVGLSAVRTAANSIMISMCKDGEIKLIRLLEGEGTPKPKNDDCQLKACHVVDDGRKRAGLRQV